MYLRRVRDCRIYIYIFSAFIYLSPRPGCGWEVVSDLFCVWLSHHLCGFTISCVAVGPSGAAHATSPSHDVTFTLSERGSLQPLLIRRKDARVWAVTGSAT